MREFIQRVFTSLRWFLGTLFVLFLIVMFFWRLFSPEHFYQVINGFLADLWEIVKSLLTIAIVVLGFVMVCGYRPFRRRGNGH